jgi:hypothetical protein
MYRVNLPINTFFLFFSISYAFAISNLNLLVAISFFLLLMVVNLFQIYSQRFFSIFNISILIFYIFFLMIAPVAQLIARGETYLVNTIPYDVDLIVYTNLIISLFLIIYLISRILFDSSVRGMSLRLPNLRVHRLGSNFRNYRLQIIALVIFMYAFNSILSSYNVMSFIGGLENYSDAGNSKMYNLLERKFLYTMPVVAVISVISIIKYHHLDSIKYRLLFILSLVIVFFLKNPVVEHRSGFGTIYLIIAYVYFSHKINSSSRLFIFFVLVFFILFPIGELLAPHRILAETSFQSVFLDVFNRVHFDSWANISGSILYVKQEGIHYGEQLISSLFFWIPRSFWELKSVASGQILGEWMTVNYSMWMTNISFPLIAEGFIDFHIIGVIIFSIIFAAIGTWVDKIIHTSNNSAIFFTAIAISVSTIFILRGPLLSSLAYTAGLTLGIYFVSSLTVNNK